MLEGPARIWLNNLPADSVSEWLGFRKLFVTNFSSTYKKPNRPEALRNCQQGPHETDREYLTRWNTVRNSCEGVEESHAIGWFCNGCRYGSMLWQKYRRVKVTTLADVIEIATTYAKADPTVSLLEQGRSNLPAGGLMATDGF
jgi:hypothetical protein